MTFRYRGFQCLVSDPTVRPVVIRVYDPFFPTRELEEFTHPDSLDYAIQLACGSVDVRCHREAERVMAACARPAAP